MSVNNKDIALSVIHFLKQSVSKNEIPEDYAESMDVAIDCIADAFEVNKDDDDKTVEAKFGGKSLAALLSASGSSKPDSEPAAPVEELDVATKEKADALKAEGNRAMASKDFSEAIKKYTEAIELDGSNVVYLSNRAAAHSSASQHENAVKDAEKAIELNPNFSKSYSRLGLAKYALGDASAAMKAYEKGLEVEGDKKSDAMTKGFETAKRRVEEELEQSIPKSSVASNDGASESAARGAGAGAGASGMPDLSSMFGGNGGGMPSFGDMMNNPQLMQAAQSLMSDPNAMQNLMSNPAIRQMADRFGGGGGDGSGPDLSNLMNNPMLQNLAGQFMGGGNNNNNNNNNNNSGDGSQN